MNSEQAAYIAGIIDGEGTISISLGQQEGGAKHITRVIRVTNTDKRLLDWLRTTTGLGKVTELWQNPNSAQNRFRKGCIKPLYAWAIYGGSISSLLPQILLYLVIKKRLAELMLKSLELAHNRGRGRAYSEEVWEEQKNTVNEVKVINRRGLFKSI